MDWVFVGRKGKKSSRPSRHAQKEGPEEVIGLQNAQPQFSTVTRPVTGRFKVRTSEEKLRDLCSQLQRIRAEVSGSEFYRSILQKLDRVEELGRDFQVTTCTDKAQPVAKGSTAQKATAECRFMRDSAGRATSDLSRESLRVREHQQSAAGTLQPMAYAKHSGHPAPDLPGASESHCWRWEAVEEMVIYGLGSLEASPVPRYQLAFALLLAERLPKLKGPLQAFDPVFTELDCALLKEQGLLVLEENEEGRRRAAQPTLFYLPHCEADLTSNLVEANLHSGGGGGGAGRVAVLGNSFALYRERWAQVGSTQAQHRRGRPDALLRAVEAGQVLEVPVSDCGFPVVSAFNDMSFHLFRDARQVSD